MHHPTDRITHTTAFVTPVVEHWLERDGLGMSNSLNTVYMVDLILVCNIKAIATGVSRFSHDWCNKGRGICNPVCGVVHIKEPLLLIGKSSPCGGSGFPLSLSVWYFTTCLTPYNRK